MSDPPPVDPPPRRVIANEEYRTSYITLFQIRMREGLHARLLDWARDEERQPAALVIEILEDAVRSRGR